MQVFRIADVTVGAGRRALGRANPTTNGAQFTRCVITWQCGTWRVLEVFLRTFATLATFPTMSQEVTTPWDFLRGFLVSTSKWFLLF